MDRGNQSIIKQAESLYFAKVISENNLGNSTNLIFELSTKEKPLILRVSNYSDSKKAHIDFELGWMKYLSRELDTIVKPILSSNNRLYEIINANDKNYILCSFEKANGKIIDIHNPLEFNESLFFNMGAMMGDIHRLTTTYSGNIVKPEFEWFNCWQFWPEYNVIIDDEVQPFAEKYINELRYLPKAKDCYGIIHEDIQILNFFVDNGHIMLFDFDDCQFNWYAYDIAVALYQMIQQTIPCQNTKERIEFAENYLLSYLKGYLQTYTINKYWISKIDMFMKFRRAGTYKFIQNKFRDEAINPHQQYLDWLKYCIISDIPFVSIDYEKILNSISGIRT